MYIRVFYSNSSNTLVSHYKCVPLANFLLHGVLFFVRPMDNETQIPWRYFCRVTRNSIGGWVLFFIRDHRCIIQSRIDGGSRGGSLRNNAACVVECAIAHRQAYFIDQARPVNLYRTASCRDANFIATRRCICCFIIPCWEFCNVVNRNFEPINANAPIRSIDGGEISNGAC